MSGTQQQRADRLAFFRQSGWMVIANTGAGVFMAGAQMLASNRMPPEEQGAFFALLKMLMVFSIPAAGLQTIVARIVASSGSSGEGQSGHLAASQVRSILKATCLAWGALALVAFATQGWLVTTLKLSGLPALWAVLGAIFAALLVPVMQGVLQGQQNFGWLGWSQMFNGFGRCVSMFVIVWLLGGRSAGAMTGALLGYTTALLVATWPARKWVHSGPKGSADWSWCGRYLGLTLGVGSTIFLMNADMLFVQSHFAKPFTDYYGAASMIAVAVVTFTAPMASVMFPKVARGSSGSGDTSALGLAVKGTLLLGGMAALGCSLLPELPLRIIFFSKPDLLKAAPLIPWLMWAVVPVTLANVLVSNLMAREDFRVVPWLVLASGGFGFSLWRVVAHPVSDQPMIALRAVIAVLAGFGLLMCLLSAWFTRKPAAR